MVSLVSSPLRAILWDVDGTLAETERDGHRIAFNTAFREASIALHWDAEEYGNRLAITGGKERIAAALQQLRGIAPDRAELERLQAAGVPAFPAVVNHDDSEMGVARKRHPGVFVRSVYFTDPNGIMMELAAFTRDFGPEDVRHAPAAATADA